MKYANKVLSRVLITLIILMSVSFTSFASSDAKDGYEFGLDHTIWMGSGGYNYSVFKYNKKTQETEYATIISYESSNPEVLEAYEKIEYIENDYPVPVWYLKPAKTGKVTVTVTYDAGEGIKTIKQKTTVKKYPDPFKSLKLNGKKVNTKKHKFEFCDYSFTGDKVTIKATLKKGWKLSYSFAESYPGGKRIKMTKKKLKNGYTIAVPNDTDLFFSINLLSPKNEYFGYTINYSKHISQNDVNNF